jgi:2-amino-4-hydroxy-6-hydroxymethyldihydropteridine diphosphokinase
VSEAVRAILSLGSNLGDREATLADAVRDIEKLDQVELRGVSSLVETAAIKPDGVDASSPAYLNLVVEIATTLEPDALLTSLNLIELEHGRVREVRWGDRTLDVDIVTMGGLQLVTDALTLPHPRAAERAFVLVPWLELDPRAELPGIGAVDALPAAHESVSRYRAEAEK